MHIIFEHLNITLKDLVALHNCFLIVDIRILILHSTISTAACPSFYINYPPMRTILCPGDVITYTCALTSSWQIISPSWTGSGFQCSNPPLPANTIAITQYSDAALNNISVSCGNLSAVMTNISGTCYTSVLTISTPQSLNGSTITCKDGFSGAIIGSDTLNIQLACESD